MPRFSALSETFASIRSSIPEFPHIRMGEDAVDAAGAMVTAVTGPRTTVLCVMDVHTADAAGNTLCDRLSGEGHPPHTLCFDPSPNADEHALIRVRAAISTHTPGLVCAIGSGTINDLCKAAAYDAGLPYMVVCTAPSMNGYTSANASITVQGHKCSRKARMPAAILADTGLLSRAPLRLIRSGVGDALCRTTAQADWLLSHLLWETAYTPLPFTWLSDSEEALMERMPSISARDPSAMEALIANLLISGLGMTYAGSSAPASQGEHLIAHLMEMRAARRQEPHRVYHGEAIAATTLISARIQDSILASDTPPALSLPSFPYPEMAETLSSPLADACADAYRVKAQWMEAGMDAALHRLSAAWPEIRQAIRYVRISADTLQATCKTAGLATTPESIGWSMEDTRTSTRLAPFIRDRFTFLDIGNLA